MKQTPTLSNEPGAVQADTLSASAIWTAIEGVHMPDEKSRAERSVDWQNRYLTPILLVVGLCLIAGAWAVGSIPWWLAVVLLVFGVFALVGVVSRNRQDT